ncbi:hypothetical protein DFP94_102531 [Fontibacillus phaseoli]|uniref:YolD-like protein n=1 Tax=Fontibacillus phaseoli TaxID=1416533 RepID=A0A369BQB1_9BACL|nr:hypothetical protein [Fontibacillus phaseoli]RCX21774.1 hypothetical protein DFP94_102531 [Fontibacillus phaseoli]
MRVLQFLLNAPIRRRIRTLQAKLELLANRVEQLELTLEASGFPDIETREKLYMSMGKPLTVLVGDSVIQGTLFSILNESLELRDDSGQLVMIPLPRITAIRF